MVAVCGCIGSFGSAYFGLFSPAECRQFAIEAGRLARQTVSRREKDALYGMARAWETLAKYIDLYEKARAAASKDAD